MRTRWSDLAAAVALLWAGLVLGVSFLATPAKFLAPSLSLPIALDVGRSTFHVSILCEAALALSLLGLVLLRRRVSRTVGVLAAAAAAIVALQMFWLLPELDLRVAQVIEGVPLPPSSLHIFYIVADALKLILLVACAWLVTAKRVRALDGPLAGMMGKARRVAR